MSSFYCELQKFKWKESVCHCTTDKNHSLALGKNGACGRNLAK